jgi:hypothetical protein
MLVTDETWVECDPIRRALAQPYQAWRCVAWTDERLNFLVVASRTRRDHEHLPDGWLVGGAEALLDAAGQLEPGSFSVYVLDRATGDIETKLSEVTGIWRERERKGDAYGFWYSNTRGEIKPCSRAQSHRGPRPELESELDLDRRGAARREPSRSKT